METPTEKQIIEASGRLLTEVGPDTSTLEKLSKRPEMKDFDVFSLVGNEELIFQQLLLQLEKELNKSLMGVPSGHESMSYLCYYILLNYKTLNTIYLDETNINCF
ncbi:MAG: hypothetical protein ACOCVA_06380 [Prolixibacteraceae bacterium]